jgi:hypothetical protein
MEDDYKYRFPHVGGGLNILNSIGRLRGSSCWDSEQNYSRPLRRNLLAVKCSDSVLIILSRAIKVYRAGYLLAANAESETKE